MFAKLYHKLVTIVSTELFHKVYNNTDICKMHISEIRTYSRKVVQIMNRFLTDSHTVHSRTIAFKVS